MLLTSAQHRAIAALLWRRAAKEPPLKRLRLLRSAQVHTGLARAQDLDASLAPATPKSIAEVYADARRLIEGEVGYQRPEVH